MFGMAAYGITVRAAPRSSRVDWLPRSWGVLERGRQPHRALPHGVAHQRLHRFELCRVRRAVVVAEDHPAHLGGAHEGGEVDACRSRRAKYSSSVRQSAVMPRLSK
jgi:hypothetical protein